MLQPKKTISSGSIPIFADDNVRVAVGGHSLVVTGLTDGDVLPAGSALKLDDAARTATLCKTAVVYEDLGNTGVAIKIKKGHQLKSTNVVAVAVGGKSYAGTLTVGTDYDTFTVGTTLGVALTAGDVLFESATEGAATGALKNTPTALLYDAVKVESGASVASAISGYVYQNRVPALSAAMIAALPQIIFTKSF